MARRRRADDLIGATAALSYFVLMAVLFVARLADWEGWDRVFGAIALLVAVPLAYLLIRGWNSRPALYLIWIVVVIAFQLVEFLLDYAFEWDFRGQLAIVIPYVMLFFAALGALIGIAAAAGRGWMIAATALFLPVAALTFVSRAATGI